MYLKLIKFLKYTDMKKDSDDERSLDSMDSKQFENERNKEMYEVLLSAGLDLQTLKSMMQHKKEASVQMRENLKKLVSCVSI